MRKALLLFPCLLLIASAGLSAEPAKPDADRKLVCQGPHRTLGSRIKRAGACRPADAADEAAEDNARRLPIGLQVKAPQREPGQRTSPN